MNSTDNVLENLLKSIDTDGKLGLPMCRDARKLRNAIFAMIYKHEGLINGRSIFYQIIDQYDPVHYAIIAMRAKCDRVIDAIDKSTSVNFDQEVNDLIDKKGIDAPVKAGKKSHSKRKDVDWLSVAKCEDKWWFKNILVRPGEDKPKEYGYKLQNLNLFSAAYKVFEYWLIDDYNLHALETMHDIAMGFSLQEIELCMDLVDDKSKRSPEYLYRVLERRQKILIAELKETTDMDEKSRVILMNLINMAKEKTASVDFQKLYKELEDIENNDKAFNKIK